MSFRLKKGKERQPLKVSEESPKQQEDLMNDKAKKFLVRAPKEQAKPSRYPSSLSMQRSKRKTREREGAPRSNF